MEKLSKSVGRINAFTLSVAALGAFLGLSPASPGSSALAKAAPAQKKGARPAPVDGQAAEGLAYFKAKEYRKAMVSLDQAVRANPSSIPTNYYLGLSAFQSGDMKTTESALCRAVVLSRKGDPYAKNALKLFATYKKELNHVMPYSCVSITGKPWHWSKDRMPVKIYVSEGMELPKGFSGKELTALKAVQIGKQMHKPDFVNRLAQQKHYRPEYRSYAMKGLHEWDWAATEEFLKYEVVKDPTKADVLVFWCELLDINQAGVTYFSSGAKEPVIIQISVGFLNHYPLQLWPRLVQSISAHEFGHAFGLQHSNFEKDLMFPVEKIKFHFSGVDQLGPNECTNNDAATLRALYQLPSNYGK
ncbi:MAG: matrixin family metalloprotease [Cyanobacteria bacterium]|nr:matrixin family metalloprotease [Cyanobacteriota bacterium]